MSLISKHALLVALVVGCIGVIVQHKLVEMLHKVPSRSVAAETACSVGASAFWTLERPPYVCAHGGDTTAHPPNTEAAYAAAISAGVDCIELDVALTADGQLVASHSRDLRQLMAKPDAKVADYTLQQLLSTSWPTGSAVLTAAEALAASSPHVKLVILDVKFSGPDRVVIDSAGTAVSEEALLSDRLLQLLEIVGCNNTLIWGKSDAFIQAIKKSTPWQLAGYSVMYDQEGSSPHFEDALRANMQDVEVAAVYHDMLDASLMGQLLAANKSVFVWPVDRPADIQRMLDLGVQGIVTNRPKLLLEALNKKQQQQCIKQR